MYLKINSESSKWVILGDGLPLYESIIDIAYSRHLQRNASSDIDCFVINSSIILLLYTNHRSVRHFLYRWDLVQIINDLPVSLIYFLLIKLYIDGGHI